MTPSAAAAIFFKSKSLDKNKHSGKIAFVSVELKNPTSNGCCNVIIYTEGWEAHGVWIPPVVALLMAVEVCIGKENTTFLSSGAHKSVSKKGYHIESIYVPDAEMLTDWEKHTAAFFGVNLILEEKNVIGDVQNLGKQSGIVEIDVNVHSAVQFRPPPLSLVDGAIVKLLLPKVLEYGTILEEFAYDLELRHPSPMWLDSVRARADRLYLMTAFALLHFRSFLFDKHKVGDMGGGFPVAALLVGSQGQIYSWGVNTAQDSRCYHAEVNALRAGLRKCIDKKLYLYTTLEPCRMCAGLLNDLREQGYSIRVFSGQEDTSDSRSPGWQVKDVTFLRSNEKLPNLFSTNPIRPKSIDLLINLVPNDGSRRNMFEELQMEFAQSNISSRLVFLESERGKVIIRDAWMALHDKLYRKYSAGLTPKPNQNFLTDLSEYIANFLIKAVGGRASRP